MPQPIYGVPSTSGQGAYGAVPGTPDPVSTANDAITGNVANLGALYDLTLGLDKATAAGAQAGMTANLPGYLANRQLQSNDIAQELAGQVPQDVIDQIAQQSAQIGAGAGMGPVSPLSNSDYLRALGLTSLGMKQTGSTALNAQIANTPVGPQFNPSSMLVTPQAQQSAAMQASLMNAAPDPTQAAETAWQQYMAALQAGQRAGINALGAGAGAGRGGSTGTPGSTQSSTTGGVGGQGFAGRGLGTQVTGMTGTAPAYPTALGGSGYAGGSVPGTSAGYDSNGQLWIALGNGVLLNTSTGETNSSGSSLFPAINAPIYGNAGTGYNMNVGTDGLPDYSQIGPNPMGGLPVDPSYVDPYNTWATGMMTGGYDPYTGGLIDTSGWYDQSYNTPAPTDTSMDQSWFDYTIGGGADFGGGGGYYGDW